jgi:hypothetical protein
MQLARATFTAMSDTTQWTSRGTARIDAHDESQCTSCCWFMILEATNPAGAVRGACHRYDYVSTEKTPLVRADDWCFEHRPNRDLSFAIQVDLLRPRSNH